MSKMKKLTALLLALVMVLALAACGGNGDDTTNNDTGKDTSNPSTGDSTEDTSNPLGYTITEFDPNATYTSHSALSSIPGNWNMHDYEDSTASSIWDNLVDSFYNMTYNDELHPKEGAEPWTSYVFLPGMAADYPTDVTEEVKAAHPDWIPADATKGYAWEIPLRHDLMFDNGTPITAQTYVESMKLLLDPRLQNYRATDVYSGAYGIVGAEAYAKAGYSLDNFLSEDDVGNTAVYPDPATFTTTDKGTLQYDGKDIVLNIGSAGNWGGSDYAVKAQSAAASKYPNIQRLLDAADSRGWVMLTADLMKDLQDYIALLQGFENTEAYAAVRGDYAYIEFEEMVFLGYEHDAVDYDANVGFYAKDDYTLVQVFNGAFEGFYLYTYAIKDSIVLVEPEIYKSCMSQDEAGVWSCTYMTSVETSPSYGPYSMTDYQTDKQFTFAKNDKWFGWTEDVYHVYKDPNDGNVYRRNMTTGFDYQYVKETATRRQMFLSGQIDTFNLEETDYEQYGHSEYAWPYPSETAAGLWVTGNMAGLNAREAAADFDQTKQDTQTVGLVSFHKALAVSLDRQAFCDECHPAYTPGYGILGDQYLYDVDGGLFYRDTDEAKKALCDFYSVDTSKFADLDEAVASITGFDLDAAKELYKAAYEESLSLGYITDADNDGICDQTITMIYASDAPADYVTRRINYLNKWVGQAVEGTPFEGKINFVESSPLGSGWIDAYRNGSADCMIAGVGGSIYDPFNAMALYCDPAQNLTANWYDPTTDMMTVSINGEDITMSVFDWYQAMMGTMVTVDGKNYSFGSADVDTNTRMVILAALEGRMMSRYDILPLCNFGSKVLLSQKLFNITDDYNPLFQGYGGRRFNYSDAEWDEYVASQGGTLQY